MLFKFTQIMLNKVQIKWEWGQSARGIPFSWNQFSILLPNGSIIVHGFYTKLPHKRSLIFNSLQIGVWRIPSFGQFLFPFLSGRSLYGHHHKLPSNSYSIFLYLLYKKQYTFFYFNGWIAITVDFFRSFAKLNKTYMTLDNLAPVLVCPIIACRYSLIE